MEYEEAVLAQNLFDALSKALKLSKLNASVTLEGAGVHWVCIADYNQRKCRVDCFGHGSGYALTLEANNATQAQGRTQKEEEIISATKLWLQDSALKDLYAAFGFIDRDKRYLNHFSQEILKHYPEMVGRVVAELQNYYGQYRLWFRANNRSCRLYFYGQDSSPTCEFYWDECFLFSVLTEPDRSMPLLIKRWLNDNAMPSTLDREFTWLETGKLSKYYEAGQGIQGEFILSWDRIETFYRDTTRLKQQPAILELIAQIRLNGHDQKLRAGQSLYTLLISRSRRHGLRSNQPYIAIDFDDNAMNIQAYFKDLPETFHLPIEFTPQIESLIQQLEAKEID